MALLFMEGYETLPEIGWTYYNNYPKNGGISQYASGGGFGWNDYAELYRLSKESTDTIFIGMDLRFWYGNTSTPTERPLLHFYYKKDQHLYVTVKPSSYDFDTVNDDILYVYNGDGTELTNFILPVKVWFTLTIKVKLHATAGTLEIWTDDTKQKDLTGLDTLNGTTAKIDTIGIGGGQGNIERDNVYMGDTSGSGLTAPLGTDAFVQVLKPNGDGDTNDFSVINSGANYTNVNYLNTWGREGNTDKDEGRVYSSTVNDRDLYTFEDIPISPDNVHGIGLSARLHCDKIGSLREVKFLAKNSSSETLSTAYVIPPIEEGSSRFQTLWVRNYIFETDPNTGNVWTEAGVNSAQVGIEITK